MAKEIGEGVAPETTPEDIELTQIEPAEDVDALKEQLSEVSEKNKQLFARAKKAEGFELKDGKWVKPPKVEPKEKPKVDAEPSKEPSQPKDLDYGKLAFYNTTADVKITGEDVEFLQEQMKETGKSQDALLGSKWFQAEMKERVSERNRNDALPKGKKRSSTPASDSVDEAYAKYKETGKLPTDFETRNKVIDKISEAEKKPFTKSPF